MIHTQARMKIKPRMYRWIEIRNSAIVCVLVTFSLSLLILFLFICSPSDFYHRLTIHLHY